MIYTAFVADEQGRIVHKTEVAIEHAPPSVALANALDRLSENMRAAARGIRISEKLDG